jgi:hypothetical protein
MTIRELAERFGMDVKVHVQDFGEGVVEVNDVEEYPDGLVLGYNRGETLEQKLLAMNGDPDGTIRVLRERGVEIV